MFSERAVGRGQSFSNGYDHDERGLVDETSPAHMGFCLYMRRILRPVWRFSLFVQDGNRVGLRCARLDFTVMATLIERLQSFVTEHDLAGEEIEAIAASSQGLEGSRSRHIAVSTGDEMARVEQKNYAKLYFLCSRVAEAMNICMLLCDAGEEAVFEACHKDIQQQLLKMSFKDLVCSRHGAEVANGLLKSLILQLQQQPSATVADIGRHLRDKCATFYSETDHVLHSGLEQLSRIDPADPSPGALKASLDLFKQMVQPSEGDVIAPFELGRRGRCPLSFTDFDEICKRYSELNYFPGIVSLALACANACDPSTSLASQESNMSYSDIQAAQGAREKYYERVFHALSRLWGSDIAQLDSVTRANLQAETISAAMASTNEAFHTRLYFWLLEEQREKDDQRLEDILVSLSTPYLESFLRGLFDKSLAALPTASAADAVDLKRNLDLQWKYYIKHGRHEAAAVTLLDLVDRAKSGLTLADRFEALSLAKMEAEVHVNESSKAGQRDSGELLNDIRERIDAANVQQEIYIELKRCLNARLEGSSSPSKSSTRKPENLQRLVQELDSQMFTVTDLYSKFAKPCQLWECVLMICHCSHHNDERLIRHTWERIMKGFYKRTPEYVRQQILSLGRRFYPSDIVFPIRYLARQLELWKMRVCPNETGIVVDMMRDIGVPHDTLFWDVYDYYMRHPLEFPDRNAPPALQRVQTGDLVTVTRHLLERWTRTLLSGTNVQFERGHFDSQRVVSTLETYMADLRTYQMDDRERAYHQNYFASLRTDILQGKYYANQR